MVTGFNTEIKHEGIVYHIQTEPRMGTNIETAVLVQGALVHKIKTPLEEFVKSPDFTDDKFQELLKEQHRQVIERIRAGEIKCTDPSADGFATPHKP